MPIKLFKEGYPIRETLLLIQVTRGVTTSGQPYASLTFQDKTGSIEGKYWDIDPGQDSLVELGQFYLVQADVISYRNNPQLKITHLTKLNPNTVNLTDFTLSAPIPLEIMEQQLKTVIDSIQDKDYQTLTRTLIDKYYDKFIVYPAAVRNHHEYTSGLLFHTLSMIKIAEFMIETYPPVDRDLVIAGILLHDLGKTIEFTSALITKYSTEGKLIGHIHIMSADILAEGQKLNIEREKIVLLQHIILAHHGKPEFGSAIPPMTKEALLVSMIDDFDAKMVMVEKALSAIEPDSFTPRLFTFDDRSFYKKK
jgi:3'-5' exoribonuclease